MRNARLISVTGPVARLPKSPENFRAQGPRRGRGLRGSNKIGVAKRIQDLQPKADPTHCHGHSVSLSVKDITKNCKLLSDTMNTAK